MSAMSGKGRFFPHNNRSADQKAKVVNNPYGNVDNLLESSLSLGTDFMSPLPPQMKGTFLDKLPSWSGTSKLASSPDTYLNVNTLRNEGKEYSKYFFFILQHLELNA